MREMPPAKELAPTARSLMRLADKTALATLDPETGSPFLSLTGVATLMDATPVLLMSGISRHSANLDKDPRASLLFDGTGHHANPLTEDRVSVNGRIVKSDSDGARHRFMARHPKAFYAAFADFFFYEMEIEDAHFVGGFGTALTIPAQPAHVLRLETDELVDLLPIEPELLAHMNEAHGESLRNIAVNLLGGDEARWRLTGLDPEGCDLMARKQRRRLTFPSRVTNGDEAGQMLVSVAKKAKT